MSEMRRKTLSGSITANNSRLFQPDSAQLFKNQKDAAKAWRDRSSLGGGSGLFSPQKAPPVAVSDDDDYQSVQQSPETSTQQFTHSDRRFPPLTFGINQRNALGSSGQAQTYSDSTISNADEDDESPFASTGRFSVTSSQFKTEQQSFTTQSDNYDPVPPTVSPAKVEIIHETEKQKAKYSPPPSPQSPKISEPDVSVVPVSIWNKVSAFTRFDQLNTIERYLLVAVALSSPFLLNQLDNGVITNMDQLQTIRTDLTSYLLNTSGRMSSHFTATISKTRNAWTAWAVTAQQQVSGLNTEQCMAAIALGILLSMALDTDVSVINGYISSAASFVGQEFLDARDSLMAIIRSNGRDHEEEEEEEEEASDSSNKYKHAAKESILSKAYHHLVPAHYLSTKLPLVLTYISAVLLLAYATRYALTHLFVAVVATVTPYSTHIYIGLIVLILLFALYQFICYRIALSRARHAVLTQLAGLTKKILLSFHSSAPYPVEYLYEEVNDVLKEQRFVGKTHGVAGSKSTPAVVVQQSSTNMLGDRMSPLPKHLQQQQSDEPKPSTLTRLVRMIFSPSSKSNNSKLNAVDDSTAAAEAAARTALLDEVNTLARAVHLKGDALKRLWKDVQKYVEKDTRIQTVDMMVDGGNRRCWRVLTGKTSVLSSLFGSK